MKRIHLKSKRGQRGVSMIEVLIALAVLSIGLTGLAAMQLGSLQNVHSAHYRSMASAIALDFEERLWLAALNTASGCPDATAYNSLVSAFQTEWTSDTGTQTFGAGSAPKSLRIPGMTITVGTVVTDTEDSPVMLVPLTFGWTEQRFSDTGESTAEAFTYNVRIHCRPVAAT